MLRILDLLQMSWEVSGECDERSYMIWLNFHGFTLADEKTTDCEGDKNKSIKTSTLL